MEESYSVIMYFQRYNNLAMLLKYVYLKLTKREELSFLTVLALPNASRIGLAFNNCCSNSP